ncbi:MAG: FAD-dependent oxidoreductase [Desulfuromonadales bacterium]|nr:FAD-dependent oxidoreductase [Desulfuromonadales bacterium]
MPRVVVLGGGYAGLACLIELYKKDKSLELHLVDADADHCKITNLHKTFQHPLEKFTVSYAELAEKYHFTFHRHRLDFSEQDLARWHQQQKLLLHKAALPYDWLVVATGAAPIQLDAGPGNFGQNELRRGEGKVLLESFLEPWAEEPLQISLVGGGATGVQVLFELHEQLRKKRIPNKLRLIDQNQRLAPSLPEGGHKYIAKKLRWAGIDYLPGTNYLGQTDSQIQLTEMATGHEYTLPSQLTLQFPGVSAAPTTMVTNAYGQVISMGSTLENILSAGDCSRFDSSGLNSLTAQAAVRKGKLVARNIVRLSGGEKPQTYRYQEKGYLVSLGAVDAIGWIGLRCNLVRGFPASVIKDALETQYDLFLDGVDTYLDFL